VLVASCWGSAAVPASDDVLQRLAPDLLGSELTGVFEDAELTCREDRADLRRCVAAGGAHWTLGGVSLNAVEAVFYDHQLARVAVYFAEARFADVLPFLSACFGAGEDWSVTLRAGMAGQFSDQIRLWETDRFVLVAQQYDGKIDRSSVIYGTTRAMAPLVQRIRSSPRGGLRDL